MQSDSALDAIKHNGSWPWCTASTNFGQSQRFDDLQLGGVTFYQMDAPMRDCYQLNVRELKKIILFWTVVYGHLLEISTKFFRRITKNVKCQTLPNWDLNLRPPACRTNNLYTYIHRKSLHISKSSRLFLLSSFFLNIKTWTLFPKTVTEE